MGQRAAPAAELIFDDVWCPKRTASATKRRLRTEPPDHVGHADADRGDRTGHRAFGYEKALAYAESRKQGGGPIVHTRRWRSCWPTWRSASKLRAVWCGALPVRSRPASRRSSSRRWRRPSPRTQPSPTRSTPSRSSAVTATWQEYGVEKLLARDAKLTQIYEGTNQINRFEIMEAVAAERVVSARRAGKSNRGAALARLEFASEALSRSASR